MSCIAIIISNPVPVEKKTEGNLGSNVYLFLFYINFANLLCIVNYSTWTYYKRKIVIFTELAFYSESCITWVKHAFACPLHAMHDEN